MKKHQAIISFIFLSGASLLAFGCAETEGRIWAEAQGGSSVGGSNAGGSSVGGSGNTTGGQGGGGGVCVPSARDCTSSNDNDCNDVPDNTECTGCTRSDNTEGAIGDDEACFTFPAPVQPKGVCKAGLKTCQATADKTALEWGSCVGEVGPTSTTDSCDPTQNGDENCDGDPRKGCPCQPGETMGCGSCSGTQTCGNDFQWGACSVPTPGNLGASCDAGCGTIQCSGQCSTAGHGGPCGSCGGIVLCNGQCSVGTPSNLGQACDAGCGTIQCNGVCNTSGHGGPCGSCGGTVLCNNQCSIGTPGNLGAACNTQCGGGSIQCNGQCSVGTCDVSYNGPGLAVGWGYCAPQKVGDTQTVYCPAGTTPVFCGMGWEAGFFGTAYDDGDGTDHIYNNKGEIDPRWNGSGCYVHIRAFNCEATTIHPTIICRG